MFYCKFLKKIGIKIFSFLVKVLAREAIRREKGNRLWNIFCKYYEKYSHDFVRYRLIPKYSSAFYKSSLITKTDCKELAIIIQGPITKNYNFTIETVKIYKIIFPGAIIIISSWIGMDEVDKEEFKNLGCEVILNEQPKPMGFCHLNYQILSTQTGLKRAKKLGAKYCLKNRSDLRINKYFSFSYLKSLIDIFKLGDDKIPLKGRIITLNGVKGQMFFPYWLQDFLYFGYTDDIINLFDIPYEQRNLVNGLIYFKGENKIKTGKDYYNTLTPETYLTLSFLKKHLNISVPTVKDSWNIISNYFIIIDSEDLNILWYKYESFYSLNVSMVEYDGKKMFTDPYRNFTFSNFINVYNNELVYDKKYESLSKEYKF